MIPSAKQPKHSRKDEQQERNRKMNHERMKSPDELTQLTVFAAVGDLEQRPYENENSAEYNRTSRGE